MSNAMLANPMCYEKREIAEIGMIDSTNGGIQKLLHGWRRGFMRGQQAEEATHFVLKTPFLMVLRQEDIDVRHC
jgi:hypothetical protein